MTTRNLGDNYEGKPYQKPLEGITGRTSRKLSAIAATETPKKKNSGRNPGESLERKRRTHSEK